MGVLTAFRVSRQIGTGSSARVPLPASLHYTMPRCRPERRKQCVPSLSRFEMNDFVSLNSTLVSQKANDCLRRLWWSRLWLQAAFLNINIQSRCNSVMIGSRRLTAIIMIIVVNFSDLDVLQYNMMSQLSCIESLDAIDYCLTNVMNYSSCLRRAPSLSYLECAEWPWMSN